MEFLGKNAIQVIKEKVQGMITSKIDAPNNDGTYVLKKDGTTTQWITDFPADSITTSNSKKFVTSAEISSWDKAASTVNDVTTIKLNNNKIILKKTDGSEITSYAAEGFSTGSGTGDVSQSDFDKLTSTVNSITSTINSDLVTNVSYNSDNNAITVQKGFGSSSSTSSFVVASSGNTTTKRVIVLLGDSYGDTLGDIYPTGNAGADYYTKTYSSTTRTDNTYSAMTDWKFIKAFNSSAIGNNLGFKGFDLESTTYLGKIHQNEDYTSGYSSNISYGVISDNSPFNKYNMIAGNLNPISRTRNPYDYSDHSGDTDHTKSDSTTTFQGGWIRKFIEKNEKAGGKYIIKHCCSIHAVGASTDKNGKGRHYNFESFLFGTKQGASETAVDDIDIATTAKFNKGTNSWYPNLISLDDISLRETYNKDTYWNEITDIIVLGGRNDDQQSSEKIAKYVKHFNDRVHYKNPKIKVHWGMVGWISSPESDDLWNLNTVLNGYKTGCQNSVNGLYMQGIENVFRNAFICGNGQTINGLPDRTHPTTRGCDIIAQAVWEYLEQGSCYVTRISSQMQVSDITGGTDNTYANWHCNTGTYVEDVRHNDNRHIYIRDGSRDSGLNIVCDSPNQPFNPGKDMGMVGSVKLPYGGVHPGTWFPVGYGAITDTNGEIYPAYFSMKFVPKEWTDSYSEKNKNFYRIHLMYADGLGIPHNISRIRIYNDIHLTFNLTGT